MNEEFFIRERLGVVALTLLAMGWTVFVFGAVAHEYRTAAGVLTAVAAGWALVRLPRRRWYPPLPWVAVAAVTVLFVFGWYMVINAVADHSMIYWKFFVREDRLLDFDWLPGSVARTTSIRAMLELSAVLLAFLAAVRATESNAWRSLLGLIAVLGALVALTGILHKAVGAETVYFIEDVKRPTIFAPFVYHGNAAQFMSLAMPVAFGLWLSTAFDDERRALSGVWALVMVVNAVGILMTASKASVGVLAVSLALLVVMNHRRLIALWSEARRQRGRRAERFVLVLGMVLLAVVLSVIGISLVITRWEDFMAGFTREGGPQTLAGRLKSIEILLTMAAPDEGGWHGFGAGSYRHLLPYFTVGETDMNYRFMHAHCDPLQTVVEWGYLGAAAWFTLGAGAVVAGVLLCFGRRADSDDAPLVRGMVIGLVVVGLHSAMDFPFSIYSIHLVAMLMCGVLWGLWTGRARPMA